MERLVEPVQRASFLDDLLCELLIPYLLLGTTHSKLRGIASGELDDDERNDGNPKQSGNHQEKTLKQVASHPLLRDGVFLHGLWHEPGVQIVSRSWRQPLHILKSSAVRSRFF